MDRIAKRKRTKQPWKGAAAGRAAILQLAVECCSKSVNFLIP
jgi:hypothetical protein